MLEKMDKKLKEFTNKGEKKMNNLELVEKFMHLAQEVECMTVEKMNNLDYAGYATDERIENTIYELMKAKKEILRRMGGSK